MNSAPTSPMGDMTLESLRLRAGRDPRKAHRHEQWRARRRQRAFDSFVESTPAQPQSFGLTAWELRSHAAELRRQGWTDAEIRMRLVDPRLVAA